MKRALLLMPFFIHLLIGLIGCQQTIKNESAQNSTVEKAIENGKWVLADGDYAKSKSNFQLALAEDKDNREVKDWLNLAEKLEMLATHIENKEVEKAEEAIADIKKNGRYGAVKNQVEDYESTLTALKSSAEKMDDEVTEQLEERNQSEALNPEPTGNFTYNTYTNPRFGFTVQYPSTFIQGPAPTNNDGRDFSNGEASILAYAGHINVLENNETIETYYNRALENAPGSISYKRLGSDWYVISYRAGTNTVYEKSIIGESIISTVIITYPSSKQDYYEPMVTYISKTLIGGQTELAW